MSHNAGAGSEPGGAKSRVAKGGVADGPSSGGVGPNARAASPVSGPADPKAGAAKGHADGIAEPVAGSNAGAAVDPIAGAEPALFSARGLVASYGSCVALDLEALELREGECLALVGPNGSGKTTLLKILAGIFRPTAGRLFFEGEEAVSSAASAKVSLGFARLKSRVVYLHQHPYLLAGTVAYNVEFGSRARGAGRAVAVERAAAALAELGLSGFERRRHRALSGGEAQRVALARAFATGADVLLLDEPTASADAASRDLILEAIRGRILAGSTIVFSTHDAALAEKLAHREIRVDSGRIANDRRLINVG